MLGVGDFGGEFGCCKGSVTWAGSCWFTTSGQGWPLRAQFVEPQEQVYKHHPLVEEVEELYLATHLGLADQEVSVAVELSACRGSALLAPLDTDSSL